MHISEGVLSAPVLAAGWALAAGGVALGVRRMEVERIPRVAMLTAAFFAASLVRVPVWPGHAHLVLNGLAGLVLGWSAFPALFVALLLQALLFQFGGLSTLGVNVWNMAAPAVLAHYLFRAGLRPARGRRTAAACAFGAGAFAVWLGVAFLAASLATGGAAFRRPALALGAVHALAGAVEGLITLSVVLFLRAVKPDLFEAERERVP